MGRRDLDYALGGATLWKGKYPIEWCELCESIILVHKECTGTTCNCHSCDKCHADFIEFSELRMEPFYFLTDEERAAVDKYKRVRDLLFKCLDAGKTTLDWQWLLWEGQMSQADEKVFAEQIKGLDRNPEWDRLRVNTD